MRGAPVACELLSLLHTQQSSQEPILEIQKGLDQICQEFITEHTETDSKLGRRKRRAFEAFLLEVLGCILILQVSHGLLASVSLCQKSDNRP